MLENEGKDKIKRVLGIYTKLMDGNIVRKSEEAMRYGVNERSIQRDIDDIRSYLEYESEDDGFINEIIYDRIDKGFRLQQIYRLKFTNSEILAISKILLDSRAFTKKEMEMLLKKLVACCVPEQNRRLINELIRNEEFHYVEPRHKTKFIDKLWEIGQAIQGRRYIEIRYARLKDRKQVKRKLRPVAIMFSEYYFYMAAFIDDEEVKEDFDVIGDSFPTIYRIDRIKRLNVLEETFRTPYKDRFEEGEFRKRIQFMYGGRLQRIRFKYSGLEVDAVLDRLPTAKVLSEEDGVYTVSAEVFGKGIDMWLRSQGDNISLIEDGYR